MINFLLWAIWNSILILFAWGISISLWKNYYRQWNNLKKIEKIYSLILFFLWVIFFPNIPYLFTEGRHLMDACEIENSRDLMLCLKNSGWSTLFYAYSSLAIIPFIDSLEKTSQVIGKMFCKFLEKVFPIIFIPISALGVQIGLVGRFNSWDIFSLKKLISFLTKQPFVLQDWLITSLGLYIIFYVISFLGVKYWRR